MAMVTAHASTCVCMRVRGCMAVDESKVNTGKWTPRERRLRLSKRFTTLLSFQLSSVPRWQLNIVKLFPIVAKSVQLQLDCVAKATCFIVRLRANACYAKLIPFHLSPSVLLCKRSFYIAVIFDQRDF